MINILIPFKKSDWSEIFYSIKSWHKYFNENFKIWILGEYKLDIPGIEYIYFNDADKKKEHTHGIKVKWAVDNFRNFIWTNDDIYLLKKINLLELKKPYYMGTIPIHRDIKSGWAKLLIDTGKKLLRNDKTIFNCESHTPYYYESEKLKLIISEYGIDTGESLLQSAYVNNFFKGRELTYIGRNKAGFYNKKTTDYSNIDNAKFLNHDENGLTETLKKIIMDKI